MESREGKLGFRFHLCHLADFKALGTSLFPDSPGLSDLINKMG